MGDVESKLNLVNSKIRQNNRNIAGRMVKPLTIIAAALFLSCTIAGLILLGKMTSDAMLTAGKTLKILSFIFAALTITGMVALLVMSFNNSSNSKEIEGSLMIFLLFGLLPTAIFLLLGNWIFSVQSVYCDEANGGMIFYEKEEVYELRNPGTNTDVVINGVLNDKRVVSYKEICTASTKSLTLDNVDWENFSNLICSEGVLEKVIIKNSTVTINQKTFKNFKKLKNLNLENSTVTVDINPGKTRSYASTNFVFYDSGVIINLYNSSLINLCDCFEKLIVSGKSEYYTEVRMAADFKPISSIKKVVFDDSAVITEEGFFKNIRSYWIGASQYYPMGSKIYLPVSIQEIPDYFFGDTLYTGQETITVYYAGSEADWNNVTISEKGNENYSNGKVIIQYNASPED